jgi:hypothetical protein
MVVGELDEISEAEAGDAPVLQQGVLSAEKR